MASTPVPSGGLTATFIDAGAVGSGAIASGSIGQFALASGAVTSGAIASGSISQFKLASGTVNSGQVGTAAILSGNIGSGQIASGHLTSGLIAGLGGGVASGVFLQYTTVELISGVRCVTLVASGFVGISRANQAPSGGSGLPCIGVVYTNTLSGTTANVMVAGQGPDALNVENPGTITGAGRSPVYVGTSGLISARPESGCTVVEIGVFTNFSGGAIINVVPATSGGIGAYRLGSGAVQSGNVGSGAIAGFGQSGGPAHAINIASGSIGGFDITDRGVVSGNIGIGAIGKTHLFAGTPGFVPQFDATFAFGVSFGQGSIITGQSQMSGGAVAFSSNASGHLTVVPAERASGLRLPAVGVMASGSASGDFATVVTAGFVAANHFIGSGFIGQSLYVGSGGFIMTQSAGGGLQTVFSGPLLVAGGAIQRIGVCISGGMLVNVDMTITSGFNTTPAGTF